MNSLKKAFLRHSEIYIFLTVWLIALSFAIYTSHTWEDYYITYRASQNLATGHGLTYTIGERVHAFTSPLGVLLPAFFNIITGNSTEILVLWLFRLVSISALASAIVLMFRIGRY